MNEDDKKNLSQLLKILHISKVICIDDNYSDAPDIGDVKAVFLKIPILKIPGIPDQNIQKLKEIEDTDRRLDKFTEIWENLEPERKIENYSAMRSINDKEPPEDFENFKNLNNIFSKYNFEAMSPKQWQTEGDNVINTARKERKIMLLFDMDLSHGAGGTEHGGIDEIKKLSNRKNIICGLITHKNAVDDEKEQWNKIALNHSIKKEDFLFISKKRLEPENILGFIKMLKLITINRIAATMRTKVKNILAKANEKAYEDLESLDVCDFDTFVCKSAWKEGMWEPDMLFRIYNTYLKHEAERLTLTDTDLQQLATDIRNASQIIGSFGQTKAGIEYEKKERYKTGEYINIHHFPIESGDIFTIGGFKYFILLSQPCELMMRSDGQRSRSFNDGLLIRITNKPYDEKPFCTPELEYWNYDTGNKFYVDFREKNITKLCILDLCVFNSNGKSIFNSKKTCPDKVLPAWQLYFNKHITKNLNKISIVYNDTKHCNKNLPARINKLFRTYAIEPFRIKHFEQQKDGFKIEFNCERVDRLCKERAAALLSQYAFYLSRAAFETDLGKGQT